MFNCEMDEAVVTIDTLYLILRMTRCHGGQGERLFVDTVIKPIEGMVTLTGKVGKSGVEEVGYYLTINKPKGDPSRTLFTAHVDTVHAANVPIVQEINVDEEFGMITQGKQPLGADDGTGIWIMLNMIQDRIPGTYLFTRGEEKGGIGAKAIADFHADFLKQFDRAIAFDRAGETDVITHQAMGRCCSDEFAEALAKELNLFGAGEYEPCDGGVYTDTAEFTEIIPECTNLSVGYYWQHGPNEYQDVGHLKKLMDAILCVDWDGLPTKRDPKDMSESGWYSSFNASFKKSLTKKPKKVLPTMYDTPEEDYHSALGGPLQYGEDDYEEGLPQDYWDLHDLGVDDLYDLMWRNPKAMSEIVWEILHEHDAKL